MACMLPRSWHKMDVIGHIHTPVILPHGNEVLPHWNRVMVGPRTSLGKVLYIQ